MKIRELLINGLMSTTIFEMAFTKKVAIDHARSLQFEIADHLVKMVMYNRSPNIKHWAAEVNSWLDKIQRRRLKGTNKPLDSKLLFDLLYDEPLGTLDDVQTSMNQNFRDYPDLTIDQPNAEQVSKTLAWVLQQVCLDISKKAFVDINTYFKEH